LEGFTVSLINTDGLVLIGPGSEWFWTALSGIVLAVTFLAIYRQLRLQASQSAIEQVERISQEWTSERMMRHLLAIFVALEGGSDPAALPDRAATAVGDFWDKVGYLVRNGHVNRHLVHGTLSGQVERWWARVRPYALANRGEAAEIWSDFEWLAAEMARLDVKLGRSVRTEPEDLVAHLSRGIAELREALETEEALRTVPVRLVATPLEVVSVRPRGADAPEPLAPKDLPPAVA
jgi:hypothetical protein